MAPRRSARSRAAPGSDGTNANRTSGEEEGGGSRGRPKGKRGRGGAGAPGGAGKKKRTKSPREDDARDNDDAASDDGPAASSDSGHSVGECLANVGVTREELEGCDTLDEEFQKIKRSYFKKILEEHPDKGGDPALFRQTRTSFEVLRDLRGRGKLRSFVPHLEDGAGPYFEQVYGAYGQEGAVPSYESYEEAAQEVTPGYKVELAKTGRSKCSKCNRKAVSSRKAGAAPKAEASASTEMRLETARSGSGPNRATSGSPAVGPVCGGGAKGGTNTSRAEKDDAAADARAAAVAIADPRPTDLVAHPAAPATLSALSPAYIPKGAVRVGSLDDQSGSYGRWFHLKCWRVPYRVWAGLQAPADRSQVLLDLLHMDEVLLTGLACLPPDAQQAFVDHVMDRGHWARKTAASKPPPPPPPPVRSSLPPDDESKKAAGASGGGKVPSPPNGETKAKSEDAPKEGATAAAEPVAPASAATAVVARAPTAKAKYVVPRPGVNGAKADCLAGKTFVLTGIFPEVGGGAGLNQGKDKVKGMIQAFGGRVTSAVSGKTSYVVVGKEPGQSKVGAARARGVPLVDLGALTNLVYGTVQKLEDAPPPAIKTFSAGYKGPAQIGN